MTVTAYPLSWPEGLPRHRNRATSQFRTGLAPALKNVRLSLEAFGRDTGRPITTAAIVISSNVTLGTEKPVDPGVAVWFDWDGGQRCIAVDRYPKVEDNLQAIHHIVEARRTEMRHGGLHIVRQTFKGFTALPAPADAKSWTEVLGLPATASPDQISIAYRTAAKAAGSDQAKLLALNLAREAAIGAKEGK